MTYLDTMRDLYRNAATVPQPTLCCTTSPVWKLPDLVLPQAMLEMNYGCGSTVHPRDLAESPTILYLGVGGGMELLQFAYFTRRPGSVIGIDPVAEMREAARSNLRKAARVNPWFREEFVVIREGDALDVGLEVRSIDVVAQNCLFNMFETPDLLKALGEVHRILRPGGRLVLSDPVAPTEIPDHLERDERLRAMCLSGALTYERYVQLLVDAGFGTIEVRARRPYRLLDPERYHLSHPILLESVEVAAIKDPVPPDGPCVFTGRTAIYFGSKERWDDGAGHVLTRDIPLPVCDKTARRFESHPGEILVTQSTWFYEGASCC